MKRCARKIAAITIGAAMASSIFFPAVSKSITANSSTYEDGTTKIELPIKRIPGYPTSIYEGLSDEKLEQVKQSFLMTYDKEKFGDDKLYVDIAPMGYIAKVAIMGKHALLNRYDKEEKVYWTNFIRRNAALFGVTDVQHFQLEYHFDKNMSEEALSTNQLINGQEELFSRMNTRITVSKSEIEGHFWPNPKLPLNASYSKADIEKLLIGKPYVYAAPPMLPLSCMDCRPEPPVLKTAILKKQNISITLAPYFYTRMIEGGIYKQTELRLVYWVNILLPDLNESILLDAVTGEHL